MEGCGTTRKGVGFRLKLRTAWYGKGAAIITGIGATMEKLRTLLWNKKKKVLEGKADSIQSSSVCSCVQPVIAYGRRAAEKIQLPRALLLTSHFSAFPDWP